MVVRGPSLRAARSASHPPRGYALFLVLLTLLLVMASLTLLALSLVQHMNDSRLEHQQVRLTALTDGGLAVALAQLTVTPYWSGQDPERWRDGVVTIHVERTIPRRREVTVEATSGNSRRTIRAEVLVDGGPPRVLRWWRVPGS